ncbi:hypothetical protein GCM10020001_076750 [Nonomuraea salmonea]
MQHAEHARGGGDADGGGDDVDGRADHGVGHGHAARGGAFERVVEVGVVVGDELDLAGQAVEALFREPGDLRGEPGLRPARPGLDGGAQHGGGADEGEAGQRRHDPVGGRAFAEQRGQHAGGGQQAERGEQPAEQAERDRGQGVAGARLPGHAQRLADERGQPSGDGQEADLRHLVGVGAPIGNGEFADVERLVLHALSVHAGTGGFRWRQGSAFVRRSTVVRGLVM